MRQSSISVFSLVLFCVFFSAARGAEEGRGGWQPDPKLLADLEARKTPYNYREGAVPKYELPDPLVCTDGSRVTSSGQWEAKRRGETLELFRQHVYGRTPKGDSGKVDLVETDARAMEGQATLRRVKNTGTRGGGSVAVAAAGPRH